MNKNPNWENFCNSFHYYPEVGISLDLSRSAFSAEYLNTLGEEITAALENMNALEAGAVANPDENRMVGHYWLRNPELAPSDEIATEIKQSIIDVMDFAGHVHSGKIKPEKAKQFTNILLIGIGGSALGPQLIADCFVNPKTALEIHFLDNTDPDGISNTLALLGQKLTQTLTIVISKSGGTAETNNGFLETKHAYENLGLSFSSHAVAITLPNSKLDKHAAESKWLARFPLWDWVGGRTSLFSPVGLLPAALQGINTEAFLTGASEMDAITRAHNIHENPALLLAVSWHAEGSGQGKKDMVVIPYKDRLVLFSKYLQQLVMESLGKEKDLNGEVVNQGISVFGNKGSTDQHAYIQQLREGVNNFFVTFITVLNETSSVTKKVSGLEVTPQIETGDFLNGFYLGTREALSEKGRTSISIALDTLNEKSVGSLIALFERAVGLYATLVNINAYHQPGVEAGKKAAENVITLQKQIADLFTKNPNKEFTLQEISTTLTGATTPETLFHILEHCVSNHRYGIYRVGKRCPKSATYVMK